MDHMQMRHSINWSEKIHTKRWYCDLDHPEPRSEPPEFDEMAAFVNHLQTDHGGKLTQSQLQGRIRRNQRIATRDPFVCPLCDCVPPDIKKRIGERPYKFLWEHIAEHLKSLAFLSLSYIGDDLEDKTSIANSSKTSDKDDPRISRDSLGNRDLENFDDIPSTVVYSKHVQVEGQDFYEEASLGESENWDFLSVKSLPTDYKYLEKHLTRSQVSLSSDQELSHGEYTVGWVCALPIELAAAQAMLDEQHHDLPQNIDDANIYTLGRIGDHNVVLACLAAGEMRINSASAVAIQMKATFPAIRFYLMVGIGGGVPSKEADIRLGDIVVSQPQKGYGGVVQYDFGKSTPNGFKRTGFLNAPPRILLAAVTKLRANYDRGINGLLLHLSKLSNLPKFARDEAGSDVLFEAEYNHVGEDGCASCAATRTIQRKARTNNTPVVHYGIIASGNQVMRNGATRDLISSEFGEVLCFEIEAAGLINSFPCLVIRGICDYADSHKNKRWQPYAAGTAAAYAKELLLVIPAVDVDEVTQG
jgi:nucleoside phosphorylase